MDLRFPVLQTFSKRELAHILNKDFRYQAKKGSIASNLTPTNSTSLAEYIRQLSNVFSVREDPIFKSSGSRERAVTGFSEVLWSSLPPYVNLKP